MRTFTLILALSAIQVSASTPLMGVWSPAAGQEQQAVRVWVNNSSGVYHCPGTRYFGNTKRGAYMTETAARAAGHRPAYGRTCGGEIPAPLPDTVRMPSRSPNPSPQSPAPAEVRVWVNTASHVYHCPETRYYGNTKRGTYMAESAARSAGNRPAYGRPCGG